MMTRWNHDHRGIGVDRLAGVPANEPLQPELLTERLCTPEVGWRRVEVLDSAPSTNGLLAERARAGEAGGLVLVTDDQRAGRGRMARSWTTPPGVSVACSALVRPEEGVSGEHWQWLSPLLGLAVSRGVRIASGLEGVELKWPNDVLIEDRKVSGLLSERVDTVQGPAAVLGFGINVTMDATELPVPTATSLLLAGGRTDATELVAAVLTELGGLLRRWAAEPGTEWLAEAYSSACQTIGRRVRVELGADQVIGVATGIGAGGGLQVRVDGQVRTFAAGDVVHLRPVGS